MIHLIIDFQTLYTGDNETGVYKSVFAGPSNNPVREQNNISVLLLKNKNQNGLLSAKGYKWMMALVL